MNGQLRTILIAFALAQLAFGQDPPSSSTPPRDRREQTEDAAKKGDQDSNQQLTPPMLSHLGRAEEARRKAQELEKSDPAAAQQERQRALAEQQQANQLKQQMDANKKSSDENKKGAEKLRDSEPVPKAAETQKMKTGIEENKVIVVSDREKKAQNNPEKSQNKDGSSPLQKELTTFADYVRPQTPAAKVEKVDVPKPPGETKEDKSLAAAPWRSDINFVLDNEKQTPSSNSGLAADGSPAAAGEAGRTTSPVTAPSSLAATPLLLRRSGPEDNGLDKDFFKPKKKSAKKGTPGRALASREKKLRKIKFVPEILSITSGKSASRETPLRTTGNLKD